MKKKLKIYAIVRIVIQLIFFIFMPAVFSTAFMGAKYIAEQIAGREVIALNPFVETLIVLLIVTVLFGRIFCGFACAFGSLGDWVFGISAVIQKKFRKKVFKMPAKIITKLRYVKYLVLIVILATCVSGQYSIIAKYDPWEVFASIISGKFSIAKSSIWVIVLLGVIIIGMCLVERFFCIFLCPMGAIFSLMPMLPWTTFGKDKEKCIKGCKLCVNTCPATISLSEENSKDGECFQCGRCALKCPKKNIRRGFQKITKNSIRLGFEKLVKKGSNEDIEKV